MLVPTGRFSISEFYADFGISRKTGQPGWSLLGIVRRAPTLTAGWVSRGFGLSSAMCSSRGLRFFSCSVLLLAVLPVWGGSARFLPTQRFELSAMEEVSPTVQRRWEISADGVVWGEIGAAMSIIPGQGAVIALEEPALDRVRFEIDLGGDEKSRFFRAREE